MKHTKFKFVLIGMAVITFIRPVLTQKYQSNVPLNGEINIITGFSDTIFAGTSKGLYISYDNGEEWKLSQFSDNDIIAFEAGGESLYTAAGYFIYCSSDRGITWNKIETPDLRACLYVIALKKHQNKLFVGLDDCNPVILTENDTALKVMTYNQEYVTGLQFMSKDSLLFIAAGNNIMRSSDTGTTIQIINPASLSDSNAIFRFITKSEHSIYLSCDKGFFRSTDNGNTWIDCTPDKFAFTDNKHCSPLAISGNALIAGLSPYGIIRSTDNGSSWQVADSGLFGRVTALSVTGTTVFAGTYNKGIFRSIDSGKTWQTANKGLFTTVTIKKKNNDLAATDNFDIKILPHSPFINITLGKPQQIEADILDLSGKKIVNLVNSNLARGSYRFMLNSIRKKSGYYILQLRVGQFRYTRSIVMIQ